MGNHVGYGCRYVDVVDPMIIPRATRAGAEHKPAGSRRETSRYILEDLYALVSDADTAAGGQDNLQVHERPRVGRAGRVGFQRNRLACPIFFHGCAIGSQRSDTAEALVRYGGTVDLDV